MATMNINDTDFEIDMNFKQGVPVEKSFDGIQSKQYEKILRDEYLKTMNQQSKKSDTKIMKHIMKPQKPDPEITKTNINDINKEKLDKYKLMFKIEKYQNSERFGEYLKKGGICHKMSEMEKMTDSKLNDIYTKIKAKILNKSAGKFYDGMIRGASLSCENMISPYYNIKGFTNLIFLQPDFLDAIEELKIDADLPYLKPHLRLVFIGLQTALGVHALNEMKNKEELPVSQIVTENEELPENEELSPEKRVRSNKRLTTL